MDPSPFDEELQRALLASMQASEPGASEGAAHETAVPPSGAASASSSSGLAPADRPAGVCFATVRAAIAELQPWQEWQRSEAALQDLRRVIENVARDAAPASRYRRLSLANPHVAQVLLVPGAEILLQAIGFARADGDALEIPAAQPSAETVARARWALDCLGLLSARLLAGAVARPQDATREDALRGMLSRTDADVASIARACDDLEACGVHSPELLAAGRARVRGLTTEALWSALGKEEQGDLDRLVRAVSLGVAYLPSDDALLVEAQGRLERLGQEQHLRHSLSVNALAAHGTRRHRVLAPLLTKLLDRRDVPAALLNFLPDKSRAFSLTPESYGLRGGHPYCKPVGWLRYSLRSANFERARRWCIAYHGTKSENAARILAEGLQQPSGQAEVAHGQTGGTGRTLYVSPSIEYAAHPVYSPLVELQPDHWAQLVLECRVAPGSFREQGRTLGPGHWPADLPFDTYRSSDAAVEWLVDDPACIVVSGLMVREFGGGAAAHSNLYGQAAARVKRGCLGPDYEWTQLRVQELRALLASAAGQVGPAPMPWPHMGAPAFPWNASPWVPQPLAPPWQLGWPLGPQPGWPLGPQPVPQPGWLPGWQPGWPRAPAQSVPTA